MLSSWTMPFTQSWQYPQAAAICTTCSVMLWDFHHICIPTVVSSPFLLSLWLVPWKSLDCLWTCTSVSYSWVFSTSVSATVRLNTKCNSGRLTGCWARQDAYRTPATLDGGIERTQKELEETSDVVVQVCGQFNVTHIQHWTIIKCNKSVLHGWCLKIKNTSLCNKTAHKVLQNNVLFKIS